MLHFPHSANFRFLAVAVALFLSSGWSVRASISRSSDSIAGKTYAGGISESCTLNSDGSMASKTISDGSSNVSVNYTQTPTSCAANYGDGTIAETYYHAGPRSSVTGPDGDARSFTYQHLEPAKETHAGGVWKGWTVEWLPDAKGRLQKLRVTGPEESRDFSYSYDGNSRVASSATPELSANYARNAAGQAASLTRDWVSTAWSYDSLGRLASVSTTTGGTSLTYSYPNYDGCNRILTRLASLGTRWMGLQYDNADNLTSVNVGSGRTLSYAYDSAGRGNRIGEGGGTVDTVNNLDEITFRQAATRYLGVAGTVSPAASVVAMHALTPPGGQSLDVDAASGDFFGLWEVPSSWSAGAIRVDAVVRATLAGTGHGGSDAVAEQEVGMVLSPKQETLGYALGRLAGDGLWTYGWDNRGRLKMMTCNLNALPAANVSSEVVSFIYDADGRRTEKMVTQTLTSGRQEVMESKVLWAGSLPVLEAQLHNGTLVRKRWFQWGPDLSGTRDGMGGIGGLEAIIEEPVHGLKRVLLPIQDGLGNITAVLDQATGQIVAHYDYGPFGETLRVSGEADACPFRWQTRWYDEESGHYYCLCRYYGPRLGRWLSRDPIGESGGFNLYAYCGNDPVNRHDPLGLDSHSVVQQRAIENLIHATEYGTPEEQRAAVAALTVLPGDPRVDPMGAPEKVLASVLAVVSGRPSEGERLRSPSAPLGSGFGHNASLFGWTAYKSAADLISIGNDPSRSLTGQQSISAKVINEEYEKRFTSDERFLANTVLTLGTFAAPAVGEKMLNLASGGLSAFRGFAFASQEALAAETAGARTVITSLSRPYIRNWVRDEVEAAAPRASDGRFIDPNTLLPTDNPVLGHKPGYEFWRLRDAAQAEGVSQHLFNETLNNPEFYQIEDTASNASHLFERP